MYCCNLSLSTVYCTVSGEENRWKNAHISNAYVNTFKIIMIALNLKLKDE